jgi:hypothetical protein
MPSWIVITRHSLALDEEGNWKTVQGIPRVFSIREISTMQLKKCYRKGCQLFAVHVEEASKDEVSKIGISCGTKGV